MAAPEIPAGILPVFLTMTTQEMFKVVSGTDVTDVMPCKRVNIAAILKDINFRGVISDWQPAKAQIEKYPTDLPKVEGDDPESSAHLLCVMDDDNVYGQNYFICLNEETAQEFLAKYASGKAEGGAAEAEAEVEEEKAEPRPKEIMDPDLVNRPWVEWTPACKIEGDSEEAEAERQKVRDHYTTTSMEIDGTRIKESGERLKYAFSRKRALFRQGGRFFDVDNAESEDFKQYRDPQFKESADQPGVFGTRFLLRDSGNSCVPTTSESSSQSARFRLVNSMVQYAPIVQESDEQAKVKEDVELLDMFSRTLPVIEDALSTNETVAVFVDDVTQLGDEETLGNTSDNAIKEYASPCTDIDYSKNKIISAIDWMPDAKCTIAVACTERASLDEQIDEDGKVRTSHILIWNFKDPIHPQMVLEAPYDIYSFRFNPNNSDLLAAGSASGQILIYDLGPAKERAAKREKASAQGSADDHKDDAHKTIKHVMASTVENSHKRQVSDLRWLPPDGEIETKQKNAGHVLSTPTTTDGVSQQIISIAPDGLILFWDLRIKKEDKNGGILWTPVWRVQLASPDGSGELTGLMFTLSTKPEDPAPAVEAPKAQDKEDEKKDKNKAAPEENLEWKTEFALGTEDGQVAHGTWVMPEGENASFISACAKAHYSPVVGVQRSPFFRDCLLTVGDWTFSLFLGASQQPVVKSSFSSSYLTCGRFSPTRPGVIFTSRADGSLDIWDLIDRSHEPSLQHNVGPEAVTALEFWGDGNVQLLAVGDKQGTLHILEIPRTLRRPVANEQGIVEALLKREQSRVQYMETRMKFREKELSIKEAEDEEKRQAAEAEAAKAAAAEAAAREAAEAQAQAMVEGDGAPEQAPAEEEAAAGSKLSKEQEAAEAKYRALEKEFRKKVGLDKDEE